MRTSSLQTRPRAGLLAAGILMLAVNLRAAITSVGPLTGAIREDTGISSGLAGLVTTLPLLAFGVLSPVVPRLARRFGAERTLLASLVVLCAGILLRSSGPVVALLGGTALLGLAITAGNVLVPSLVKRDFPRRAGAMTGLYTAVMGASAAIAVGFAVPLADGLGLGWRGALACWAVPAAAGALVWVAPVRRHGRPTPAAEPTARAARRGGDRAAGAVRGLWGSALAWQVTFFMGLQSLAYYSTIAWLPEILHERGLATASAGWLLSLTQITGLVTSLSVPLLAVRRPSQRAPAAVAALVSLCGYSGLLLAGRTLVLLWCLLIGLAQGALFSLALTLFALRAPDARHAAELSGMAQSVGYLLAAAGPTLFGLLHDLTGAWTLSLAGLAATSAALVAAGLGAGRDAYVGTPPARPAVATPAARPRRGR